VRAIGPTDSTRGSTGFSGAQIPKSGRCDDFRNLGQNASFPHCQRAKSGVCRHEPFGPRDIVPARPHISHSSRLDPRTCVREEPRLCVTTTAAKTLDLFLNLRIGDLMLRSRTLRLGLPVRGKAKRTACVSNAVCPEHA
jgi:hypothetical protein